MLLQAAIVMCLVGLIGVVSWAYGSWRGRRRRVVLVVEDE